MQHPNMLELTQSALLIIDMQEGFRAKITNFNQTAARIALVPTAAKLLKLPVFVTEQYPKRLGHTPTEISEALPEETERVEKTAFSSCGAQRLEEQLKRSGAKQVVDEQFKAVQGLIK